MYTLCNISRETVDTPNKLNDVICDQYGSVVGVDAQQMDVGYFYQAKKLWINNRLDMNDFWDVIERGDKLTLWCVRVDHTVTQSMPRKRSTGDDDNETGEAIKKSKPLKKGSTAEEKRPLLVIMIINVSCSRLQVTPDHHHFTVTFSVTQCFPQGGGTRVAPPFPGLISFDVVTGIH